MHPSKIGHCIHETLEAPLHCERHWFQSSSSRATRWAILLATSLWSYHIPTHWYSHISSQTLWQNAYKQIIKCCAGASTAMQLRHLFYSGSTSTAECNNKMSEFVAQLWKLSEYCWFGDHAAGRHAAWSSGLWLSRQATSMDSSDSSIRYLTFDKVFKMVRAMEMAEQESQNATHWLLNLVTCRKRPGFPHGPTPLLWPFLSFSLPSSPFSFTWGYVTRIRFFSHLVVVVTVTQKQLLSKTI